MKKRIMRNLLTVAVVAAALTGCNTAAGNQTTEGELQQEVSVSAEEVFAHMTLRPVKNEIKTGADFRALDKIPAGEWLVEGVEGTELSVSEYENAKDGNTYKVAKVIIRDNWITSFRNPVLVKEGGYTYIYGEGYNRALERMRLIEGKETLKEEKVLWTDLPEGVTKCGEGSNLHDIGTLGESQEADGAWRYGVYVEGEEMAALKSEKQLLFNDDEGIAVSEDGDVYMLYYSSEPWTLRAFKVNMPEAVDVHSDSSFWMVEESYIEDGRYGFAYVDAGENIYIIKTEQVEALQRNGMDNLKHHTSLLQEAPTYTVVKAEPQNFDSYATYFGSNALEFYVKGQLKGQDGYTFYKDYHLTEEVEKHYLGLIIPREELEEVWGGEFDSYTEVQQAIKRLNAFLDNWEKENPVKVQNFFLGSPQWVKHYPEVAEKYGITLEGDIAVLNIQ